MRTKAINAHLNRRTDKRGTIKDSADPLPLVQVLVCVSQNCHILIRKRARGIASRVTTFLLASAFRLEGHIYEKA
jgi:hypothetical protein